MKKAEGIALQNRLEYMKDKVARKDKEIERLNKAVEELQQASEILLKTVALRYGGDEKEIIVDRRKDLNAWKADVTMAEDHMKIKLKEVK